MATNSTQEWWYVSDGQKVGPISGAELSALLINGKIDSSTLVWSPGLHEWKMARDVNGLVPPELSPPPLPETASQSREPPEFDQSSIPSSSPGIEQSESPGKSEEFGSQVRPWIRYWARFIDISTFAFAVGVVEELFALPVFEIPEPFLSLSLLFAYIFFEPILLSSWGTTFGKALLNIRLRTAAGKKLSYGEALERNFSIWVRGLGLGIPLVSLFTLVNAYQKLTSNQITSWDKDGGYTVQHRPIGTARVIILVFVLVLIALAIFAGLQEM